jgi:hypothetical protein
MSTVVKLDRKDVQIIVDETLANEVGEFTKDKFRADVDAQIGPISQSTLLANARHWYEQLIEKCVDSAISRKANLKVVSRDGQVDYLAFGEQLIRLGQGMYVHRRDAGLGALAIRADHQQSNMDNVIANYEKERDAEQPVREYMIVHDIPTFMGAVKAMGLA